MLGPPWWIPPDAIVLCKSADEARNGEVAVILFTDEGRATLKQFFRERRRVRLVPLNAEHEAIVLEGKAAQGIRVQGIAVSVHHGPVRG